MHPGELVRFYGSLSATPSRCASHSLVSAMAPGTRMPHPHTTTDSPGTVAGSCAGAAMAQVRRA